LIQIVNPDPGGRQLNPDPDGGTRCRKLEASGDGDMIQL
jgi:hypothetical protein